jgi:hypothetical protein
MHAQLTIAIEQSDEWVGLPVHFAARSEELQQREEIAVLGSEYMRPDVPGLALRGQIILSGMRAEPGPEECTLPPAGAVLRRRYHLIAIHATVAILISLNMTSPALTSKQRGEPVPVRRWVHAAHHRRRTPSSMQKKTPGICRA